MANHYIVQGVWSHETALEVYGLSDVMPARLHMTVPKGFRKGVAFPQDLVLHFAGLSQTDILNQQGYFITTPIRTIFDIVKAGTLSLDLIIQAIQDALRKGVISRQQLNELTLSSIGSKLSRILNEYEI